MSEVIRLALVEDHPILLESMRVFFNHVPGMEVVFAVSNGKELIKRITQTPVDVVLLDLEMPEMDGKRALKLLRNRSFRYPRVIILSMHSGSSFVKKFMLAGANAYLNKGCEMDILIEAIRTVHTEGQYFSPDISNDIQVHILEERNLGNEQNDADLLSSRELEITRYVCQGMKTKDIALRLALSTRTVENHRRKIGQKLGVNNVYEMIREAIRRGYLDMDE
jgi:DNA-binding NarL/FixJ family response regulator